MQALVLILAALIPYFWTEADAENGKDVVYCYVVF